MRMPCIWCIIWYARSEASRAEHRIFPIRTVESELLETEISIEFARFYRDRLNPEIKTRSSAPKVGARFASMTWKTEQMKHSFLNCDATRI